ncbi:MAG: dethiobiotin synthase [Gammaproteobacteria bacterium]|nr:dethiobiotin synthase [Gammaproteobacteria bacterium]NNJ51444.1 dethiobiotin synthase [Gammaproteobacteria bacterium]
MQGVFITGTSTEIGKTFIGVAIATALTKRDIKVIPRKPIESGCTRNDAELIPQDAAALKQAASYQGPLSEVCPYRFEPPVSPVRAAHLADKILTTEQLAGICMEGSEQGFLLVEGAGGFYSPLAKDGLNADLAVALQLPVLLVADDRLGALSQVLLNVEAIKMRGLPLAGVVLNQLDTDQNDHMDNSADLRERLDCPLFTMPYSKQGVATEADALIDALMLPCKPKGPHIRAVG